MSSMHVMVVCKVKCIPSIQEHINRNINGTCYLIKLSAICSEEFLCLLSILWQTQTIDLFSKDRLIDDCMSQYTGNWHVWQDAFAN